MKLDSHKSVNCVIVQGVEGTIYKEGRVILPINTADNEFATLPITPWARVVVVGARQAAILKLKSKHRNV